MPVGVYGVSRHHLSRGAAAPSRPTSAVGGLERRVQVGDDVVGMLAAAGPDERREIWRCYLDAAMRFPWTPLGAGGEAASVWCPPGAEEMTADQ